jgi:2-hydroxymuconate-semialdehyde hydrolase
MSRAVLVAAAAALIGGPSGAQAQPPATDRSMSGGAGTASDRLVLGDGDTLAVTTTGHGPAIVIVPGLIGGGYGFRHVSGQLVAAGLRVIVVHPLGTGESAQPRSADYTLEAQARRLAHALDSTGVASALLVCHSVSASICYRHALLEPGRVRGILAINGGPDEHAATPGLRRAMKFAPILRIIGGAGRARARLRDGLRESSADPSWVTEEVVDAYARPYRDFGAALNALGGMASAREPALLKPRLDELQVPVRLLVGDAGNGLTTADQIEVLRLIPDFAVQQVAGAGQYIQEERPDEIVKAILSLHGATLAAGRRR